MPFFSDDPALLQSFDWFMYFTNSTATYTDAQIAAPSVAVSKQKLLDVISGLSNLQRENRKPVVWHTFAQSNRDWFKSGWVEDGPCGSCLPHQQAQVTDFSIQAIAMEAQLEAIAEQKLFETVAVETSGYWFTDTILPKDGFPNYAHTVRNKPSEAIVRAWFAGNANAPMATVNEGLVVSSKQTSAASFLRVENAGTGAGTVTVTLRNGTTGAPFSQWTSTPVAAGASRQFSISEMEASAGSAARPDYFTMSVQSTVPGSLQHVLFRPADGTLTNLSTCESGVSAGASKLINVHSSFLSTLGFPGLVVVTNTGATSQAATLGIYNAGTGVKLGTYVTTAIAAGAQQRLSLAAIELGAGVVASQANAQYNIKLETPFSGFLQQLVNNQVAGVTTDMSTVCTVARVGSVAVASAATTPLQLTINSTSQTAGQSFLRVYNSSAAAASASVQLTDDTGAVRGTWASPAIPAGASVQFDVSTIETGAGLGSTARPANFRLAIAPAWRGAIQHVLYRPSDGTLSNLSTCDRGVAANPALLVNVHSSLFDNYGFPSTVGIVNTGSVDMKIQLGLYNAATGEKLGVYNSGKIASGAQAVLPIAAIETGAGLSSASGVLHYNIKAENTFTGFVQHIVTNSKAGVATDMTTVCKVN